MSDVILWADARWVSPWVLSVWVALTEKNVPFQVQELELEAGQHRKGDYPRKSVNGKVPAITHGELWISESLAILEYLEEAFPEPRLFAGDAAGRAQDRLLLSYLRSDFAELRRCMPFEGIFLPGRTPAITPLARDQCRTLLDLADWRIGTRGTREPGIADVELAAMLRRPIHYRGPLTPQARAFSNAVWKRPSVRSWLAHDRSRFSLPEETPRSPRAKPAARAAAHRAGARVRKAPKK